MRARRAITEATRERAGSRPPERRRGAGAARRRARAGARQGDRHRGGHQDQPARHRAPDNQDSAARRLCGQGARDGDRLVGGRPVPLEERRRQSRVAAARAREEGGTRMIGTTPAVGWYVFGVVPSDASPPVGTYLVERGPLAAVAAEVPLAEFGEDALRDHLNDRAWLED